MTVKSTCVDVCRFDIGTGWCGGCGRTRAEIAQWRKLTPYRRSGLERELHRRLDRLGHRFVLTGHNRSQPQPTHLDATITRTPTVSQSTERGVETVVSAIVQPSSLTTVCRRLLWWTRPHPGPLSHMTSCWIRPPPTTSNDHHAASTRPDVARRRGVRRPLLIGAFPCRFPALHRVFCAPLALSHS